MFKNFFKKDSKNIREVYGYEEYDKQYIKSLREQNARLHKSLQEKIVNMAKYSTQNDYDVHFNFNDFSIQVLSVERIYCKKTHSHKTFVMFYFIQNPENIQEWEAVTSKKKHQFLVDEFRKSLENSVEKYYNVQ